MKKVAMLMIAAVLLVAMLAVPGSAFAAHAGNDFVCPVLNPVVGTHDRNAAPIFSGDYTVVPAGCMRLNVPDHATSMDGLVGTAGLHSKPGDTGYPAIWNGYTVPIFPWAVLWSA